LIGKILYKLFSEPEKAKRHLYDSFLLANSFCPKVVTEEIWYRLASKYLQKISNKILKEEKNISAENKKYYDMMREDPVKCKEVKRKVDKEFLLFFNSKFALGIEMTSNFKKFALKYIRKIHPENILKRAP